MENQTSVTEFILLVFPSIQKVHALLFVGVLVMYILTVTGNIIIIAIVLTDCTLHKPMYFFLGNLSSLGILYVSATIPKLLTSLLDAKKSISIAGCKAQAFSHFFLGATEFFLLTAMSFDCYTLHYICSLLHYTTILSGRLSFASWASGFLTIFVQSFLVFQLPFCGPNVINHFYCDVEPLLQLACTETCCVERLIFIVAAVVLFSTSILTIVSYSFIIFAVLRIPSASVKQKAFSTCTAHLSVLLLLYGAVIFIHARPSGYASRSKNNAVSLPNTLVTALLSPFIYTLRIREVKTALKKAVIGNKILEVKQ
ncbi:LOW QUALITY PROTEIN: olfactory receptor 6X1-like [Rhea pennata]|uniref:LOW QUALITY PROTEIN: olfactory receptor 6X1-like n=1 Tax=Rhea pennata TaxID=8795 RepID=UPI002E27323A